ncbi:MAG: hypothetical protein ACKV2T_11610 [Kofleriaceae bacterium]
MAKAKAEEDPMIAKAFDASRHGELAQAIENLSPDEAQFFLTKLEAALKKRRLQLIGYLVAMVVWLVGTVFALAYYGLHDGFTGWVFLVPFAFVGIILFVFGRWAERVGKVTLPQAKVKDAKATAKSE